MGTILKTTIVLALLSVIVRQMAKGFRASNAQRIERRNLLALMAAETIAAGVLMISGQSCLHEVTACIALGTMGFYFMILSFVQKKLEQFMQACTAIVLVMYALYHLASLFWPLPLPGLTLTSNVTMSVPLLITLIYGVSLAQKISDVKFVLKSGAFWKSVCLITDVIYIVILLLYVSGYFLVVVNCTNVPMWVYTLCSLLMISIQYAIVSRINSASLFVFWEDQERRFIESVRLNHSDFNSDCPGVDVLYKNVYDRIIDYFDTNRPYLNSELTVNDVVNALFTNKLYISKAISMHTGRNFCQFVNYYRVTYAVELFRTDPTLKIVEVASRAGFNSSVSFSTAFRLYVGEKPSDWFRQERARLLKRKK